MSPAVKILMICLAISSAWISHAFAVTPVSADLRCKALFGETSATRRPFQPQFTTLLDAGRWLRANANSVNPQTTHMPAFESLATGIKTRIGEVLPSKSGEENYATNEPLLRGLMKEIEDRVTRKNITYEWISSLPYRIGFLLKMDGTAPMFLRPGSDPNFMFDPLSYATHGNFVVLLKKAKELKSNPALRIPSVLNALVEGLESFPQQRMLPYFGDLTVREINHLVADESWPIGISADPLHVDSVFHDQFAFPLHDMAHASARYDHLYKEQIPAHLINAIERDALKQIEILQMSGQDFEVQQYIHFAVFHEGMAADFTLQKNGSWTTELTPQTMSEGMTDALTSIKGFLIDKSEGLPHLFEDLRNVAKFSNEHEAKASIERNILDYLKKVEAAVHRHTPAR